MTALNSAALASLDPRVPVPAYDRAGLGAGVVHIGVGGFHRAHQAVYVDRLLAGGARGWGICGVGVLPQDARMRDVLRAQDGLYTVVARHPDGALEPRVVGSLAGYLLAPDDPDAAVERLAAPTTRVVTLTVTEGGYGVSPATGEFDPDASGAAADLRPGAAPATWFGLVAEALARRRDRGVPPFTVASCDNVQGNGDVARRALVAFARLRDARRGPGTGDARTGGTGLGDYVAEEVRFPGSMVDRITPATTDGDRAALADRFGVDDAWPVVCEPFSQWVLEDAFGPLGRPPLEGAGVQLVADVEPYELMKLRLLNAGHQALAYLGALAGHRYVHEAAQDPALAALLRAYMAREATPTLRPVPGVDLDAYRRTLLGRFASPQVRDTLARVGAETSDRIPKFLLPVVREQLARGGPVALSALVVASWARYCEGADEAGRPLAVVDPRRDELVAAAARQRADPLAFLRVRAVFGDLADDPRFAAPYAAALRRLHEAGALAAAREAVAAAG